MAESLLQRQDSSKKTLAVLGLVFVIGLVLSLLLAYGLALRTREQLIESQTLTYTPPVNTNVHEVKRILLKREGKNGVEYLEILSDGTVNLYDANMKLIKSGLQGFGRINQLFEQFADHLEDWDSYFNGLGNYTLTIVTNLGTYTYEVAGNGSGTGGLIDDLIGEVEDIVDQTFAPTPTKKPTPTPPIYPPTSTPTPLPSNPTLTPRPTDIDWNPLTPTPLPEYMTAPPFSCSDYNIGHPFTISNVICGTDN